MQTIFQIFKQHYPHWKPQTGLFGVEIETETKNFKAYPEAFHLPFVTSTTETNEYTGDSHSKYDVPLTHWKAISDNSLRDFGVEYVLKKPLSYQNTLLALDEFDNVLSKVPFLTDSISTSVHVHTNMLNETPLTVANFVTLWTFFENVLVEYCGPNRRSNLFAAPIRVTEGIKDNFVRMIEMMEKGSYSAISWSDQNAKYAALNISTLPKFGSLEVRPMRGTTDMSVLKTWVGILNQLYLYSKKPGLTPAKILDNYKVIGHYLLHDVFNGYAYTLKTPCTQAHMERNEAYVLDLVTAVKDPWDTFGLKYAKASEKKKSEFNLLGKKKTGAAAMTVEQIAQYAAMLQPNPVPQSAWGTTPTPIFDEPESDF